MTVASGSDLLGTIVAAARRITAVREEARPAAALEGALVRRPRGPEFEAALRVSAAPRVIAECKRRSPSRGILREDYRPAEHARAYAAAGAAAISVLTEPTFFDGSLDHLREVREAVELPLLRKDFIVSEYQVLEAAVHGADAVLLIVGALDPASIRQLIAACDRLGLAPLVEVHDREELAAAADAGARIIGVNSRNLRTLGVDRRVLDDMMGAMPRNVTVVAESGIQSSDDIARLTRAGYHAFLVGEHLIAAGDPGAALRELRS